MKNFIYIICLLILTAACKNKEALTYTEYKDLQEVNLLEIKDLTKIEEGKFYYPKFTASGTKAVFTSENYTGLWYYDFETKIINQLNPSIGAGINFDVAKSGDKVYFRLQSTSANGETKNYSIAEQDINSKAISILYTSQIYLSGPIALSDGNVAFLLDNQIKIINPETKKMAENNDNENVIAFAYENIIKYKKGEVSQEVIPSDEGKVFWVEVSSKNDKLFFNTSDKGTGVYNINTKEIVWLGYYKYLSSSSVSNLIAFTEFENNNNELFISTDKNSKKFNISKSADENEMFPDWSKDGEQIIFNTSDGVIKIVKFKIISGSNV